VLGTGAGDDDAGAMARHWNTMTFVAARRHDRIEAPWLLDGPMNGERFRVYVERVLAPTLLPGDVLVMDNLGSHKGHAVRSAIRKAGAKLFLLPKHSPDLNPIEQVFVKLKHMLRKASARTQDTVCTSIGTPLSTYTPQECSNYSHQLRLLPEPKPSDSNLKSCRGIRPVSKFFDQRSFSRPAASVTFLKIIKVRWGSAGSVDNSTGG
jgi:transposase